MLFFTQIPWKDISYSFNVEKKLQLPVLSPFVRTHGHFFFPSTKLHKAAAAASWPSPPDSCTGKRMKILARTTETLASSPEVRPHRRAERDREASNGAFAVSDWNRSRHERLRDRWGINLRLCCFSDFDSSRRKVSTVCGNFRTLRLHGVKWLCTATVYLARP